MRTVPKVSVIIPVYNVEKYLNECLDSVLEQTLEDIEVICVDDGSTDGSTDILREYAQTDKRLSIICQENKGAGAARNVGMEAAQGEYLYFMDSDDYCALDFLEKAVKCADQRTTDILVFNYCRFDEQTGEKEYRNGLVKERCPRGKEVFSYVDCPNEICKIVNPTPWNKLYLNTFVRSSGLKWLEVSTTNDITFATLSVMAAKRISYLDETFLFYRVNLQNSITNRKKYNQDNVIKAVLSVDKQAQKFSYYDEVKNSIREFIVTNLLNALKSYTPDSDSIYHLEFKRKICSIFFSYPLFLNAEEYRFKDMQVYRKMEEYRLEAMMRQDYSYSPRVIVSMTSFPQRIRTVYKAIASIYRQTKRPDMVILWLAESQFPNREEDLPLELKEYQAFGLQIRFCKEDLRPHKKYFYAMQEYPEDIIITVDDDLIYDPRMIESLYVSYLHYPHAVSSVRTHLIKGENDQIALYDDWIMEYSGLVGYPSMQLFSTSGAGTLYPPHCMDSEVFHMERIKSLCLNADDLWLKIMQVRAGTPVVLVDTFKTLRYIEGTQEVALRNDNVYSAANDEQLKAILSVYDTDKMCVSRMLAEKIDENTEPKIFNFYINNKYGMFNSDSTFVEVSKKYRETQRELKDLKKSVSYRTGLVLTYIPRKVKVALYCYKQFGLKFTIGKLKDYFVRVFTKK